MSPPALLRILKTFTQRARAKLKSPYNDRVFIFADRTGKIQWLTDTMVYKALDSFIKRHGLTSFSLSSLRTLGGDVTLQVTGGDIKAQQDALGHLSSSTTAQSYQGEPARNRRAQSLAESMNHRERRVGSNGKIDTRGKVLGEHYKTASTPGFLCAEPYFSPQPCQKAGRLCDAYGACPDCPLSMVNIEDPRSYVRLTQMTEGYRACRIKMDPSRWAKYWQPRLQKMVEYWLPRFSKEIIAASVHIQLPPVPEVE